MKTQLLLIAFLISMYSTAQVYVDASATGANDGSSWTNAYTDLATATAANTNTEIWIAAGTYSPGPNITDKILVNTGTRLLGGFNGTETSSNQRDFLNNPTIISGDVNGNDSGTLSYSNTTRSDNNYRLSQVNGVGNGVVYDGLIFSGAHAIGSANGDREGSALLVQKDTQILNCTFTDNVAARGGTVSVGGPQVNATLRIQNSNFRNNLCSFANTFYSTRADVSLQMVNVQITNNVNTNFSGVSGFGGVIWLRPASGTNNIQMVNCTVADNVFNNNSGTLDLVRSTSTTNNGSFRFDNNIFWNNGAGYRVFHIQSGSASSIDVNNNIDADDFSNISTSSSTNVTNTITADPLFTNSSNGDYKPANNSPAVNSGENSLYNATFSNVTYNGEDRIKASIIDRGAIESDVTQITLTSGIFVDINATGNNDGTSWQDAYTNVETALNNHPGNFLWIAKGTYKPSGTSPIDVPTDTKLYGGFDGTETFLNERDYENNPTIFSGDINDDDDTLLAFSDNAATKTDNVNRIMVVRGSNVEIDGFTFTGGNAFSTASTGLQEGAAITATIDSSIRNCVFENNVAQRGGAAIATYDVTGINTGTLTISNCIIRRNRAAFGTGIYNTTASSNHKLEILGCSFEDNITGSNSTANAGIIWHRNTSNNTNTITDFLMSNCTIAGNNSISSGARDAHIWTTRSNGAAVIELFNSIFQNNTQTFNGNTVNTPVFSNQGGSRTFIIDNNMDEDNFSNLSSTAMNTISGMPGFIDIANSDYRITSSSAAAGAGNLSLANGVNDNDYFGNSRSSNTWDLGAYSSLSTAGIEDRKSLDISIYPNPATNQFTIELDQEQIDQIVMYNLQVQLVKTSNNERVNISDLNSGIYLVKVTSTSGNTVTEKLIKK